MEIALDKESQRKTPSVVYINKNERLFGNAALNIVIFQIRTIPMIDYLMF